MNILHLSFFYLYLNLNILLKENFITSKFQNQQKIMRVTRPLFTFLAIFFLFSNITFSQSSLFNDAKELANYLEEDFSVTLQLEKAENSNATISVMRDGTVLPSIDSNTYNFSHYGNYNIEIKNLHNSDFFIITFLADTFPIISKNDLVSLDSLNEGTDLTFDITNFPDKVLLTLKSIGEEKLETPSLLKEFKKGQFGDNKSELKNIIQAINIMNSHANFKNLNSEISISNLHSQYSHNPFLNSLNLENDFLNPDVGNYFDFFGSYADGKSFFRNLQTEFPSYYYNNNPWHKLLYGDSILQLQKTVSFEDTNSSYRTRIVSSQKELTEASIRIDRTNKSRNLLDAKTVAVGLSDFIAERAQEELNLTFFNRFKKNMEKPSELTVLFPNTRTLLYQFEISDYKTLLSHARESFTVDLDNLGLNFPKVLKLKKYETLYNSPEVFNLSLIYSIADLAYKEVPVETILVSGFQKLQERKSELKKSINIELADAFLAASIPTGVKDPKMTRSLIQNNPQLDSLKSYVKEYLDALDNSKKILDETSGSFDQMVNRNINRVYAMTPETDQQKDIVVTINKIQNSINNTNSTLSKNFNRDIFYNNRRISNNSDNSILSFYKNTVLTNLRGKEYYGYIIQNPRLDDYDNYLKIEPDSINGIIAEGLEGSRKLIDENFEQHINQYYDFLEESTKQYRIERINYRLAEKTNETRKEKIIHFFKRVQLLKAAIAKEIEFWKTATNDDEASFHLAGLKLLNALVYEDPFIGLFYEVANELEMGVNSFEQITENFYQNSLGKDFNDNLILANERLDSIKVDFVDKFNVLNREFGGNTMMAPTVQMQLLETEFERDSIHIMDKIKQEEFKFLARNIFLENSMFVEEDGETELMETPVTSLPNFGTEEYLKDLKDLEKKLEQLQIDLRGATDETEKDNINNKIDNLTDEKDALVEKREEEVNIQKEIIERNHKIIYENLLAEKEKLSRNHHALKAAIATSNSLSKVRDAHKLEDNYYFDKFLTSEQKENTLDSLNHFDIDVYDTKLDSSKVIIDDLKNKSVQLKTYISSLENRYCKDLIEAEKNAKNLSTGMEIATHLLFAFRDYEKIRDTLFFEDSVFVKVTINQLDSLSGFTNTYTSDSLRIIEKPIEGTTEQLIAARWITKKEFETLRKNDLQWNIFLGLLYQRLTSIEDAPDFSPRGVAILATKFLSITNDMDTYRNELRRKKAIDPNSISFKDYYPFIRSTVDLFNTVITTPSIGDTTTIATNFGLKNIPVISNEALSLYENIYAKNYGNAILNSMQLLKIITHEKRQERRNKKNKLTNKREARKSQLAINAVLTYGTFMANMINAESSDQVKNILQSATLPPGSSRIKRETVSSFTINSYLGAAIGRDRLLGIPENLDLEQDAFGASMAVPIGFTYSFSPNLIKNNSSFSIHVPLIDLGAITAYRQNPDNPNYSIDALPDFSWNNLFSPGLFVVYNFAESPFSLGVGGQYGPQLRQITINTGEAINVNSWRFPMAFFTIDVPFFNLHTGARKIIVK